MAKHLIKRACGHEETVNICGPVKDRDRTAEYESTRLCFECYRAERDAASAQAAADSGLPA